MSIADRIKIFLVENKISQYWLSEETKIALPKLNASLNNKRKISAEEYQSIIIALNVDANTFIQYEK